MIRTVELYGAPVDQAALVCRGCCDPAVPADGECRWSHRDGSPLCWYLDGHVTEPVETNRSTGTAAETPLFGGRRFHQTGTLLAYTGTRIAEQQSAAG